MTLKKQRVLPGGEGEKEHSSQEGFARGLKTRGHTMSESLESNEQPLQNVMVLNPWLSYLMYLGLSLLIGCAIQSDTYQTVLTLSDA